MQSLTIIRDKFTGRTMAEVMSLVTVVFMVAPACAPLLNQGIMIEGQWQLIKVRMIRVCSENTTFVTFDTKPCRSIWRPFAAGR